jgi:hypothetical protein
VSVVDLSAGGERPEDEEAGQEDLPLAEAGVAVQPHHVHNHHVEGNQEVDHDVQVDPQRDARVVLLPMLDLQNIVKYWKNLT